LGKGEEQRTVDTSEEVSLEVELIEGFDGFFPVSFDFGGVFHADLVVCGRELFS